MPDRNPGKIEVFSPYSPDECASRVTAAIDDETLFWLRGWFGSKPVIGRVSGLTLKLHKRIRYRNSFQRFFTATMRPHDGGTIISGTFGMHPFVRIFMLIWFGGLITVGTGLVASVINGSFRSSSGPNGNFLGAAIPLGMLIFGIGLVRFGLFLARNEARFITDFLIQTLNGEERGSVK